VRKKPLRIFSTTRPGSFVLLLFFLLPLAEAGQAQALQTVADSVDYELEYRMQHLRLITFWPKLSELSNWTDLVELKYFAEESAKKGDWELALIYLEEIFAEIPADFQIGAPQSKREPEADRAETAFEKMFQWGMDFSRQLYHLTFGDQDSAILETYNNPFVGMQLRWSSFQGYRKTLTAEMLARFSRDYSQVNGRMETAGKAFGWLAYQTLSAIEWLGYRREFPLKYWQVLQQFRLRWPLSRQIEILTEIELQYRRSLQESEYFPSYTRDRVRAELAWNGPFNGRSSLSWQNEQRNQKHFTAYGYNDSRLDAQYYRWMGQKSHLLFWYQYRDMRYPDPASDSLYLSDFRQQYLSLSFKKGILGSFALLLKGEGIWRDYPDAISFLSDYSRYRLEPGLLFDLSDQVSLGVSYLLEVKRYRTPENRAADWTLDQNLFAEGVELTLDFYNYRNLLISLSHLFRLSTYEDVPEAVVPGLSLYTDRFENSTLLYISYQPFRPLQINLMFQHDLDRDREIANNDSRSSIFSLDIGWRF